METVRKIIHTLLTVVACATVIISQTSGTTDGRQPSQEAAQTSAEPGYAIVEASAPQQITGKLETPLLSTVFEVLNPEKEEVSQVKEPAPEPAEPEPCPVTEEEIVMLAKVLYRECGGLSWNGTKWGVSYKARQAAVAWCAFNRVNSPDYPDTLRGVLTFPNAFAYIEDTPVTDDLLWLARDVVSRWWAEAQGEADVGRTLPENFYFFGGDGRENHFRDNYRAPYTVWDWSLPDPYAE